MIVVDWDMGPLVEYLRASARGGGVVSQLAAAAGGVGVCSIGGVLRGNSLFSADGAAVGMVSWAVVWSVLFGTCFRELCATCWSVGKLLLLLLLLLLPPYLLCELSRSGL